MSRWFRIGNKAYVELQAGWGWALYNYNTKKYIRKLSNREVQKAYTQAIAIQQEQRQRQQEHISEPFNDYRPTRRTRRKFLGLF